MVTLLTKSGLSEPVSRVLYPDVPIRFTPAASRKNEVNRDNRDGDHLSSPGVTTGVKRPTRGLGRASLISLYLVLLRMGFAQPAGHPAAGELLTRHFTLILDFSRDGMFLWRFP